MGRVSRHHDRSFQVGPECRFGLRSPDDRRQIRTVWRHLAHLLLMETFEYRYNLAAYETRQVVSTTLTVGVYRGRVQVPDAPNRSGRIDLDAELAELRQQVQSLTAENSRLLRLLDLTGDEARPPGPVQTGIFDAHPGAVDAQSASSRPLTTPSLHTTSVCSLRRQARARPSLHAPRSRPTGYQRWSSSIARPSPTSGAPGFASCLA
jgi:hypothetical protein